jgi:hypothetical protein
LPTSRWPRRSRRAEAKEGEKVSEDRIIRLLELDLEYLHRTIDKFDNQRFSIRSWTVTMGGALLALAVSAKNVGVPIVGLFAVAFFAYLEIVYMDMQVRVMARSTRVGQLLHSLVSDPSTLPDGDYEFGISAALGKDPFRWANVPNILRSRPESYMFYLGLMAAMILSAVLIWVFR